MILITALTLCFLIQVATSVKNHKQNDIQLYRILTNKWISLLEGLLTSGVIFIIDYGYHSSEYFLKDRCDGTLVCMHNHTPNFNPLINIGRQDISTFVNFTHISNIAKSLNLLVDGYISQSSFLINLLVPGAGIFVDTCMFLVFIFFFDIKTLYT